MSDIDSLMDKSKKMWDNIEKIKEQIYDLETSRQVLEREHQKIELEIDLELRKNDLIKKKN